MGISIELGWYKNLTILCISSKVDRSVALSVQICEKLSMFFNQSRIHHWKLKAQELFGIDLRSLAIFRISIALIIIVDLIGRFTDLEAHYTNRGVLPIDEVIEHSPKWRVSVHLLNGSIEFQTALFIIAGLFAVALLLGYRTRLVTPVVWLLTISVNSRNWLLMQGGDYLLCLLLFWGMFLPLGARYSIDHLRTPDQFQESNLIFSGGTVAALLQICFVYWFSVALKLPKNWIIRGTGVYYALMLDRYVTNFGKLLLESPPLLLKFLTYATIGLETFGPLLAFSPLFSGPVRCLVILSFIIFHFIMGRALELGLFTYICMASWLLFVPSWFWDQFLGKFKTPVQGVYSPMREQAAWKNLLAIFFLIYVLMWNLRTVYPSLFFPRAVQSIGHTLRLDQWWGLFRGPSRNDGWHVIVGELQDGTQVNLLNPDRTVSWEKPELVVAIHKNHRWRRWFRSLMFKEDYARYLCQHWNETHTGEKQITSLKIYYLHERNYLNRRVSQPRKELLLHYTCDYISQEVQPR